MNVRVLSCLLAGALGGLAGLAPSAKPEAPGAGPKVLTNSIGMKLALIPAGKFLMGSPATEPEREDKEVQHEVTISRPFYLGAYEVTQAQFARLMGKVNEGGKHNPHNPGARFAAGSGGGPDHPIENIRWFHAVAFCKRLTALPAEKRAGRTYRLPTEAEWEYACRAGSSTPFHFGTSLSAKQANFNGRFPYGGAPVGPYLRKTARVGSYAPNAWGLYDMHGNVAEWCSDFYDKNYYRHSPRVDPRGPARGVLSTGFGAWPDRTKQFYRVARGGCWLDEGRGCRSAYRLKAMPQEANRLIGFRVVCEVGARAP
jgi:formylglycine-generating enzyme required for sulfatase activity